MRPNVNVTVGGPKNPSEYTYKNVVLKSNLPFASQIGDSNCIYVIKWDFDLDKNFVEIPDNCILKFEGGSLRNGELNLNNTLIIADYPILDCKLYGTIKNDVIEALWIINPDEIKLQNLIELLTSGQTFRFDKTEYTLQKNLNIPITDTYFGTDDQPCIQFRNKSNIKIDGNGATLRVNTHAQGIMEIFNCHKIIIKDLTLIGDNENVQLDRTTGRGEKGATGDKYYTVGFWGYHKNNSYNTSYRHLYGRSEYDDPGTPEWGTFNSGYIGNIGVGLLIYRGSSDVKVTNIDVSGFNYAGIQIGYAADNLNHDGHGFTDKTISENVIIENCMLHDLYSSGISVSDCDTYTIKDCHIYNIGHPDSQLTDTYHDPGYGITVNCVFNGDCLNGNINGNTVEKCIRKGIDFHMGRDSVISDNIIKDCIIGAIYAVSTEVQHLVKNIIISNNLIEHCSLSVNGVEGACMLGHAWAVESDEHQNILFTGNNIKNCGGTSNYEGVIQIPQGKGIVVSNNIINNLKESEAETIAQFLITVGTDKIADTPIKYPSEIVIQDNLLMSSTMYGVGIYPICTESLDIINNIYKNTDTEGGAMCVYANTLPELTNVNVVGNKAILAKAWNGGAFSFAQTNYTGYDNSSNIGAIVPYSAGNPKENKEFATARIPNGESRTVNIESSGDSLLMTQDKNGEIVILLCDAADGIYMLGNHIIFTTDPNDAVGRILVERTSSTQLTITNNASEAAVNVQYKSIAGFK